MKRITLLVLLGVAVTAHALKCAKGCEPYLDTCVCDIQPETAQAVKPSDEKPPKSGMPAWEAPGIKLIDAPSAAEDDRKQDAEKAAADKEGKRAAGIR